MIYFLGGDFLLSLGTHDLLESVNSHFCLGPAHIIHEATPSGLHCNKVHPPPHENILLCLKENMIFYEKLFSPPYVILCFYGTNYAISSIKRTYLFFKQKRKLLKRYFQIQGKGSPWDVHSIVNKANFSSVTFRWLFKVLGGGEDIGT